MQGPVSSTCGSLARTDGWQEGRQAAHGGVQGGVNPAVHAADWEGWHPQHILHRRKPLCNAAVMQQRARAEAAGSLQGMGVQSSIEALFIRLIGWRVCIWGCLRDLLHEPCVAGRGLPNLWSALVGCRARYDFELEPSSHLQSGRERVWVSIGRRDGLQVPPLLKPHVWQANQQHAGQWFLGTRTHGHPNRAVHGQVDGCPPWRVQLPHSNRCRKQYGGCAGLVRTRVHVRNRGCGQEMMDTRFSLLIPVCC